MARTRGSGAKRAARKGGTRRTATDRKKKENEIASIQDTDQFGYRNRMMFFFIKIFHLIDVILGVACIAYGVTLHIDKKFRQIGDYFITFGCTLVFSSLLGYIGFAVASGKRTGLLLSAYFAFLIGFGEIIMVTYLISGQKSFFAFLTKHNVDFDLTHDEVATLQQYFIPICLLIGLIGILELTRFYSLRKLRSDLISIENVVSARHNASSDPLLEEAYDESEDTDSDFAPVDGQLYTDGNWWADKNQFEDIIKDENSAKGSVLPKEEAKTEGLV